MERFCNCHHTTINLNSQTVTKTTRAVGMLRSLDCDNVQPGDLDPSAADSRVYTEQNRNEETQNRTEHFIICCCHVFQVALLAGELFWGEGGCPGRATVCFCPIGAISIVVSMHDSLPWLHFGQFVLMKSLPCCSRTIFCEYGSDGVCFLLNIVIFTLTTVRNHSLQPPGGIGVPPPHEIHVIVAGG